MLKIFLFSLYLTIKKQRKVWLSFLLVSIFSIGISIVAAYVASGYLSQGLLTDKLKLGLINYDTHSYTKNAIDSLFSAKSSGDAIAFVKFENEEELYKEMKDGNILGAIVIPVGFVDSILSGENKPPRVLADPNNPLYALLLEQLARSLSDILSTSQSGVYASVDLYKEFSPNNENISYEELLQINTKFMLTTLSRWSMFSEVVLTVVGGSPVVLHYLIMLGIFFIILASAVISPVFNIGEGRDTLLELNRVGALNPMIYSRLLSGYFPYLVLMSVVLPFLIPTVGTLKLIFLIIVLSLAVYSLPLFIYTILGNGMHTSAVILAVAIYSLFVAGGIIPEIFLPKAIVSQRIFSPIYYISRAITSDSIWFSLVVFVVACIMIFISVVAVKNRLRR